MAIYSQLSVAKGKTVKIIIYSQLSATKKTLKWLFTDALEFPCRSENRLNVLSKIYMNKSVKTVVYKMVLV